MRVFWVAICIFCSSHAFGVEPAYRVETYPLKNLHTTSIRSLKVIYIENTNWTIESILSEMEKVNEIFSQCDFQFSDIQVLRLSNPAYFDRPEVFDLTQYLSQIGFKKLKEPVLTFAKGATGKIALFNEDPAGFSVNHVLVDPTKEEERRSENTMFVFEKILTPEYKAERDENYSTVAHEIAHVFFNSGHVAFPNLLGETKYIVNAKITAHQCAALKKFNLNIR
jgi:hypothetical protein